LPAHYFQGIGISVKIAILVNVSVRVARGSHYLLNRLH